jgi:ATP-dependent helicase STH1/SNF2
VPLSTLTNWTLEFEKWAPAVRCVILKGGPLQRKEQYGRIRSGDFQVCMTTYEYVIKERPLLSKIKWVHMIIDEGHRMKNVKSKLSQTLNEYYTTRYRLILTGTPLQVSSQTVRQTSS